MHRIDTSTALKDKFGSGKNGYTDGDPSTGRQATDLDADMFDELQEEICAPIEEAGITLQKGVRNQLLTALKKLFIAEDDSRVSGALQKAKNLSDVADASTTLANIGGVPTTRKINSKALSDDITLSAGDVGAVQQGGGTGMLTNKVYLGWTGSKLKVQVDTTDEGEIYTTYNCPFPVGFVMLLGNLADPNAYFPGTTWVNQSGSFGGRVLAIGTAPGTVGGANSITLSAANLPGHSHQGGVSAPGAAYAQFKTGTDNTGTYTLNYTNGTFTDNTNGVSVTNAPFSVQNEFVHFCCWLRTA